MLLLAIESSCDDTSLALLDINDESIHILAEKTASQIDIHKQYGGVIPELAGRKHAEKIIPIVDAIMQDHPKPDAIAVTAGPGLVTGLLVGVEVAKNLAYLWNIPLIQTNHIDGHIHSIAIQEKTEEVAHTHIEYPALSLTVSGGHTALMYMPEPGVYQQIGSTRDDAAGECFDKVAKLLDLSYPGGPKISALAEQGNRKAIPFPRPMMNHESFDMSFAGLKTAARYWLRDHDFAETSDPENGKMTKEDFCASFEQAIVDVLTAKLKRAVQKYQPKTVILAGGVSANSLLREQVKSMMATDCPESIFYYPLRKYCMDNATMIGLAGYQQAKRNNYTPWQDITVDPNWRLGQE